MKQKFNISLLLLSGLFILACSSAPSTVQSTGNMALDGLNSMLSRVPVDGYPSGEAMTKKDWNGMIKAAIPVVREVLPQVPQGYNL
ncbi:MAG TPA: hypothetical protein PK307_06045 [Spirochaetota bacterium]|nr:hypothetical protein [Spirochaetota bacterium]HOD15022.1 hypothetical protein [Spirochaetota bacterium]HPG49475.1 hypothetical protein [Spirochaetota bacterium]HPN11046.1 hypothetical protein [Spirochaetota bacterium]HQL81741.1 hypothetical protein [Spirochaetota bacterium]